MSKTSTYNDQPNNDIDELTKQLTNLIATFKEKELFGNVKGTCKEFCPQSEVLKRKIDNFRLSPYERIHSIKMYSDKYYEAPKKTAMYHPEEFRTIDTLENCLSYLMEMYFTETQSRQCYYILYNKLKALTFDIYTQGLKCLRTAYLLKRIIRFYLLLKYDIFEYNYSKGLPIVFQLNEALNYAINIYANYNPILNIELFKYYILLNIVKKEQIGKYYYLRNMKEFELIFHIFEAYHTDNANDFFYSFNRLSFFEGCSVLSAIYPFRLHMIDLYKKVFKNSLIETNIINERLSLNLEDTQLLIDKGVLIITKQTSFYFFEDLDTQLNSKSDEQKKFKQFLPTDLKRIYPKNILREINTPELEVSKYIHPDKEILQDLKHKTRFFKIRNFLNLWTDSLKRMFKKVLLVYEDTIIIKSYLNKFVKQSLNDNMKMDLMTLKDFDIKKGLEYHLIFFIINENKKSSIKEKYFFLNLLVKSPIELNDFSLDFKKIPKDLIKKDNIPNLLNEK